MRASVPSICNGPLTGSSSERGRDDGYGEGCSRCSVRDGVTFGLLLGVYMVVALLATSRLRWILWAILGVVVLLALTAQDDRQQTPQRIECYSTYC
jgi:hypothetical protein